MPAADDRRQRRREAFIEAGAELIAERAFENVSLSAIVRRSGGSLQTFYEMFGSKSGLLRTMVEHYDHWPQPVQARCVEIAPAEALTEIDLGIFVPTRLGR